MDHQALVASIAPCGLICRLCFRADLCDGCRSDRNLCDRNLSDEGCPQRECSLERGIDGCWECPDLATCDKGIYALQLSPKVKAFAFYLRDHGAEDFIAAVVRNMERGFNVEKDRDYDALTIGGVHTLLRTGELPAE